MDSEQEIEKVAHSLQYVEGWLKRNNVAASALGRTVCQDQGLVSRWRASGVGGVSPNKRYTIARYILDHPTGIPGYTRGGPGRRRGTWASAVSKSSAAAKHRAEESSTGSTAVPVPALSALESESDIVWVKARAQRLQIPLVTVLAEMVALGIRLTQEVEFEEAQDATK